jgi:hypothetical protein
VLGEREALPRRYRTATMPRFKGPAAEFRKRETLVTLMSKVIVAATVIAAVLLNTS